MAVSPKARARITALRIAGAPLQASALDAGVRRETSDRWVERVRACLEAGDVLYAMTGHTVWVINRHGHHVQRTPYLRTEHCTQCGHAI